MKSSSNTILTHSKGNERVHAFPKGIKLAFSLVDIFNGKSIIVEEQQ